jgi:adenylate cyclase class IV
MTESTQDHFTHWNESDPIYSVPVSVMQKLLRILEVAHENTKELIEVSGQKYEERPCLRVEREIKAYVQDRDEIDRILETLRTELGIEL